MAEKLYETLAKEALMIIHQHRKAAKEIGDVVQINNADPRLSDFGREDAMNNLREELKALNQKKTDELKAVIQKFMNEYQIVHTDDGKADPQVIANALKVIEMCGFGLTTDLLRGVVEPLKDSYTSLKMIRSLLMTKTNDSGMGFNSDVLVLMDEYIGANPEIIAYEDVLESVKEMLNMKELVSAGIHGEPDYSSGVINRLIDETCYSTLCLCDNMMKVGKLYDVVYLKYPKLFK